MGETAHSKKELHTQKMFIIYYYTFYKKYFIIILLFYIIIIIREILIADLYWSL